MADEKQIERALINLLSNAVKYTAQGTITVRAFSDNKEITVEVEDTGAGIHQEDMTRLFTEFYRVENELNKNVKGTGLGLALVRNIITAHQGRIWVTSEPNVKTTFHFSIPFEPSKPEIQENKEGVIS
jgi:signal transduction histidine kinase